MIQFVGVAVCCQFEPLFILIFASRSQFKSAAGVGG